jgi:hypothetical protein
MIRWKKHVEENVGYFAAISQYLCGETLNMSDKIAEFGADIFIFI